MSARKCSIFVVDVTLAWLLSSRDYLGDETMTLYIVFGVILYAICGVLIFIVSCIIENRVANFEGDDAPIIFICMLIWPAVLFFILSSLSFGLIQKFTKYVYDKRNKE